MPKPRTEPFSQEYQGHPSAWLVTWAEWNRFERLRKDGTGYIEAFATAPVGTIVWLVHNDHTRWGCWGRVINSEIIGTDKQGHRYNFRTTFQLIAEPVRW